MIHSKYLKKETTINSVRYTETLGILREKKSIKRVRSNVDQVLLRRENARPRWHRATVHAIGTLAFKIVPRPFLQPGFGTV